MAIRTKSAASSTSAAPADSNLWEDAPTEFTRRCVFMHIYGDTGTGRTSLALTAPGPIGLAHCGEKIDGVIQRFASDKTIRMVNFGGSFKGTPEQISVQANAVWSKMTSAWFDAVDHWGRTVVLDTDTEAWELIRLARFGLLNPKGRTDSLYGPVNAEWKSLFKHIRTQSRCNIVTIGQAKDEYIDKVRNGQVTSMRTGRTIRAGQKDIPFMADVVVRTSKEDGVFRATVEKGWFSAFSEGMTFDNEDARFSNIMALITDTPEEEWM